MTLIIGAVAYGVENSLVHARDLRLESMSSSDALPLQPCGPHPTIPDVRVPVSSSRRRHFENLELCVHRSEKSMETLLRSFDLDLSGDCLVESSVIGAPSNLDYLLSAQSTGYWRTPESSGVERADCSFSEYQTSDNVQHSPHINAYVSTPLCHNHSPSLSRSTMQRILRSPSLRPEASANGDISHLSLPEIHQRTSDKTFGPGICAVKEIESAIPNDYPLTPPPTARLENSERFSSPARSSSTDDVLTNPGSVRRLSISAAQGRRTDQEISIQSYLDRNSDMSPITVDALCASLPSDETSSYALSSTEISTQFTIQQGHRAIPHTGTIFAPSILWDLPKGIRAPIVEQSAANEVSHTAGDHPREVLHFPSTSSPLRSPSSLPLRSDDTSHSATKSTDVQSSLWKQARSATLEEEFQELLLQQAAGDSALAEDLMGLVVRLDRLCGSRRKLADLINMKLGRL